MNIYELFGLVLVAAMVVMLLMAAHALGEPERKARKAREGERSRDKSGA
jgi:hypothetical protein